MSGSNFIIIHLKDDFMQQQPNAPLEFLKKYFSDSILTGGGQIDDTLSKLSKEQMKAFIHFTEPNVAKRVADRKSIPIGMFSFEVELGKLNIRRPILIDGNNVGIE